jgi:hypothetical protein
MRYYKGHIALSDARDVPVLLHIRNARAICFDQLCALLSLLTGKSWAWAVELRQWYE